MQLTQVATAGNKLGFNLLGKLFDGSENVFFSSPSIALAVAMATNGAKGKTRTGMCKVLGVKISELDELNTANKQLMTELMTADPKVKVEIANALFARQSYGFHDSFLNSARDWYAATVDRLDFKGDKKGSLTRMNGWCDEKTHGKIKTILEDIPPAAILYILNAVYFKGTWTFEFDKKLTTDRDFTPAGLKTRKHPTMYRKGDFSYLENPKFQAISLPYGDGRYSMYVFLPSDKSTLKSFVSGLKVASWDKWLQSFNEAPGQIYVPKFELEYKVKLNDTLKALGMELAFDQDADFSNMVLPPETAKIDEVRHKTYVKVDEEGTEAAAVTSIGMVRTTSVRVPQKSFIMDVNRPFFCVIRDNTTGGLLFEGAINEPK